HAAAQEILPARVLWRPALGLRGLRAVVPGVTARIDAGREVDINDAQRLDRPPYPRLLWFRNLARLARGVGIGFFQFASVGTGRAAKHHVTPIHGPLQHLAHRRRTPPVRPPLLRT